MICILNKPIKSAVSKLYLIIWHYWHLAPDTWLLAQISVLFQVKVFKSNILDFNLNNFPPKVDPFVWAFQVICPSVLQAISSLHFWLIKSLTFSYYGVIGLKTWAKKTLEIHQTGELISMIWKRLNYQPSVSLILDFTNHLPYFVWYSRSKIMWSPL